MSAKEKIIEAAYRAISLNADIDFASDRQALAEAVAEAVLAALDAQPFHTVNLREDGWTLKHPLDCRDQLFDCEYNAATGALDGVPESGPGIYRVSLNDRGWLVIEERTDGD
jgi:hypothetical protein